ncbi:response regulator [Enterococcus faecalis]|uniref:response regulator n=1 Tax=Enterococcus faecalis TaxID=1351 RepID=UPI0021B0A322|nr:response regulator [Enterococcus faecalis]
MKILTVEDDNMIREGISEYLSEFGYTVIQAKDGREALSKFNSDINLVILDIQIPFINGLEVLKEIRKKSNLPILILTAFSDEEYKIGVCQYSCRIFIFHLSKSRTSLWSVGLVIQ